MQYKVKQTKISFQSGGVTCAGYLFQPEGVTEKVPCIVLGHGFTGTQDRLKGSAEFFASRGMAALTFDYRHFGESAGAPRQVVNIKEQLEDFHNAIAFARNVAFVDAEKIGVWGSSLGGGHVISVAAEDPKIAAVVGQVPFNGFPKKVEGRSKASTNALLKVMIKDKIRGMFGRPPIYIKAVGGPGELAVMASKEAQKTIESMQSDTWQNKLAPRALLDMMKYKPGKVAHKIKVPVLLCLGEFDKETQGPTQQQLAEGPKAIIKTYPVAHFDFYRPDIRKQLLSDQADFLEEAFKI